MKVDGHRLFEAIKADESSGNRSADPGKVRRHAGRSQNFHHFHAALSGEWGSGVDICGLRSRARSRSRAPPIETDGLSPFTKPAEVDFFLACNLKVKDGLQSSEISFISMFR